MGPTELNFELIVYSPSDDTFKMTNFTSLYQMLTAELVAEFYGVSIWSMKRNRLLKNVFTCFK